MTDRPPLHEQFAALPPEIQSRMFRILDVIIGASHDEKWVMRTALDVAAKAPSTALADHLPQLLASVSSLVLWADVEAERRPASEIVKEMI